MFWKILLGGGIVGGLIWLLTSESEAHAAPAPHDQPTAANDLKRLYAANQPAYNAVIALLGQPATTETRSQLIQYAAVLEAQGYHELSQDLAKKAQSIPAPPGEAAA